MDMKKEPEPKQELNSFSWKAMLAVTCFAFVAGAFAKEYLNKVENPQKTLHSCSVNMEMTEKDGHLVTTITSNGTTEACAPFLNAIQQSQSDDTEDADSNDVPCDPTAASDATASGANAQ